ncbi:tektin-1 [Labrus bergylta]|uniref:Tektin n=1 Tax=Labrus bergylta TaxID=56723 RepID=A0A3Q3GK07_9LABR|nr:tektin-1-like [Labrus bergylta]XP_029135802.1 tektin-1-like [Labrus bergylta]
MSVQQSISQQGSGLNLKNMETVRGHCELFRAECSRLILETDKACKRMQSDDTERLDQRVRDIQFLKKELELKLEDIIVGIDDLMVLQSRGIKALEVSKELTRVTVLCLEERMKRLPAERRHDDVDKELMKEREVFEGVEAVLTRVLEQINEQIRLNRSAKYQLEHNLKEKFEAQSIDNSCALLTAHSINQLQSFKNPQTVMMSLAVTPEQWENITDIHMAQAEQQKTNSLSLHVLVASLLEQMAADMQMQYQATTTAFQCNIQALRSAKSQMEDQLAKILSEVACQKSIREDLRVAINDSERGLSLANARLDLRSLRPGKEQCYDPAQAQLLGEVQLLPSNINRLREAVVRSEEQQRSLIRCQLDLQENIEFKANSLYIDEVICTGHRKSITIHNF